MSPEHFFICPVFNYKIKRRSKKNFSDRLKILYNISLFFKVLIFFLLLDMNFFSF